MPVQTRSKSLFVACLAILLTVVLQIASWEALRWFGYGRHTAMFGPVSVCAVALVILCGLVRDERLTSVLMPAAVAGLVADMSFYLKPAYAPSNALFVLFLALMAGMSFAATLRFRQIEQIEWLRRDLSNVCFVFCFFSVSAYAPLFWAQGGAWWGGAAFALQVIFFSKLTLEYDFFREAHA